MRILHSAVALICMISVMLAASPVSAQTSYTNPSLGYVVTLPAEWEIRADNSVDGVDTLRFTNGSVVAFLTTYFTDQTPAECIDEAVQTIQSRPQHDDFAFTQPVSETDGAATAVFGYTFVTAAGEQLNGRDRMTCWSLPDAGAMVRLEFLLLERSLIAEQTAMAEIETAVANALAPMMSPAVDAGAATPIAGESQDDVEVATAVPTVATESPQEPLQPQTESAVTGTSYISPTFGYGLTWDASWTVNSEASDSQGDYLGLDHPDRIFADLIGEIPSQVTANCFDYIAAFYANHDDYRNVVATPDAASAVPGVWDFTGVITLTSTPASGGEIELVIYLSCSHIPGQDAIVSLEQSVFTEDFDLLKPEMDALRQGFVMSATGQTPAPGQGQVESTAVAVPTVTPVATVTATITGGTTGASGVSGMSYVSPTYGYRLSWDATWTVDAESTENGTDYLALTNGRVTAELISESWDPLIGNCFEWIVDFYELKYDNVRASQDAVSAVPGVWEITGAIAITDPDATTNAEQINYVACSALPDQNVVVSLEQFVYPIDAPGQLSAMDALRASFSLTG